MYNLKKFGLHYQANLEKIIQGVTGSNKEGSGDIFTVGLTKRM